MISCHFWWSVVRRGLQKFLFIPVVPIPERGLSRPSVALRFYGARFAHQCSTFGLAALGMSLYRCMYEKKISILGSDYHDSLSECIHPEQLWSRYGGTSEKTPVTNFMNITNYFLVFDSKYER